MGVFSRFLDIVNSNINALLDQAEDPEKMIKLMINEMEDTIIEIKSNCAAAIGSKNTMDRKVKELESLVDRWQNRAELAIASGRDALAREALLEKKKLSQELASLKEEASKYDATIAKYKEDIAKLEEKLASAKAKYQSMREASQKAQAQAQASKGFSYSTGYDAGTSGKAPGDGGYGSNGYGSNGYGNDDPMERFNRMEERINRMNARREQDKASDDLDSKFRDLEELDEIQKELDALKKKMENK